MWACKGLNRVGLEFAEHEQFHPRQRFSGHLAALQLARLKEGTITATERGDVVGAERQWGQISGLIRSGIRDGLTLDVEARDLQQVRDRLKRGKHASASKLTRSQNHARRQSKQSPG